MKRRRWRHAVVLLVVGVVAVCSVGTAPASAKRATIPSHPCKLKLHKQLAALRLTGSCKQAKPGPSPLGKVSSGTWGKQPHVLGIGFFAFASAAKMRLFKQSFVTIGPGARSVGPNEVETITSSGVAFAGIIKGIGINLSVNEASASAAVKRKDAKTVLALIKALARQL